jgi:amino acid transporter
MVITTLICYFNIKKYLNSNKKIEKMEIEKRVKVFNILTVITMIFSIITLIIRIIK